jgi:hypothetical protein
VTEQPVLPAVVSPLFVVRLAVVATLGATRRLLSLLFLSAWAENAGMRVGFY